MVSKEKRGKKNIIPNCNLALLFLKNIRYPNWAPDRLSLLVILATCAIANLPYFLNVYFPVHDTLSVFQIFSYYYSELIFTHTFPWWLPLTSYGMPIDSHILFSFGPFQYLFLVIGYLFNFRDTLHLFSASLAFDSLFLGLGSFVFCQHILKEKISSLICSVSILLLIFYDRQVYWNFKILVPLPFVLFLMQKGFEKVNLTYLLWGIAILLSWSFGSVTYTIIAQVYIIAMYCLLLWIGIKVFSEPHHFDFLTCLKYIKNKIFRREIIFFSMIPIIIISFCLIMMYGIKSVMRDHMAYNALGRGLNLGVDLKTYLTYGGNGGPEKLLEILNCLPTSNPHDFLVYIGLVNFVFVLIGVMSMRWTTSQIALSLTAVITIAFTVVSTRVAILAYALPGMNFIRHIAYFITVGKLFLIILAGFGMKALIGNYAKYKYVLLIFSGALTLLITHLDNTSLYSRHTVIVAVVLIVFGVISWVFNASMRVFIVGCLFISLIDIVSYRIVVFKMADLFLIAFPNEFRTAQPPPPYQSTRLEGNNTIVLKRFRIKPIDIYGGGDSYLREDFCKGSRQDLVSPGVKKLFQLRVWRDRIMTDPRDAFDTYGDKTLKKVLGCGVPKLRLVSNVRFVKDANMAAQFVCCHADIYDRPVIIAPRSAEVSNPPIRISEKNHIEVKEFFSNRMKIMVHNIETIPLWLIYADSFDDRWKAFIDGKAQKIYKANIAFKAIKVEPGPHTIILTLSRPWMNLIFSIFVLLLSSLSASIIGLVLWGLARKSKA